MDTKSSWRAFLLHVGIAMAVFAAANVATYWTSGYFAREREYHAKVNGFFDRAHVRSVFAGDSHVQQLENDLLVSDAYNIAFGGDSLREVYAKMRYLLSKPNHIDTLFLSADPHMFGTGRLESSNRAFADQYLLWTASPYGLPHGWPAAALDSVPLFNDDFVQYLKKRIAGTLKREGRRAPQQEDQVSWVRLSESERTAIARSTGEEDHEGIGSHREPFEWLERIADLARAHHVRVVAILYPAHASYLQSISAEAAATVHDELTAAGIQQVLDFRGAITDPRFFSDPDHLNREGAIVLLRLIDARIGQQLLTEGLRRGPVPLTAASQADH
jgi:hypothetical protein